MEETTAKTIQSYDRTAASFALKNYAIELTEQKERFMRLLPEQEKPPLLDLGCGPGRDTLYFKESGFPTVGVDLSAGMLAEAKQRIPQGQFVQADMRRLPFVSGAFGGVWACASLLHLPKRDGARALAEMGRVLTKQGALFLGVKRGLDEAWRDNPHEDLHFFFAYYLPNEIWNLVFEAGFEIKGISENISQTNTEPDGSPVRWINLYAQKVAP